MVERVVVGPWKTNCYIYSSTKKECIIIDPGGSEEEIASRVDVLNMVPIGIALTHGHADHLAALGKLRDSYAARGYRLPIAINPSDRRFLGTGGIESHRENLEFIGLDEATFFDAESEELPKADVRLREGDRVFDMDIVVLETPGHTPGSVCFYSEREGILFSGDTLFFDGVGKTDLPGGSEKKLRESIQKKIAVLPPETRVFPGHGPFTTVEREKRGNPYFRNLLQEPRPTGITGSPLLLARSGAAARPPLPARASGASSPAAAASRPRPSSASAKKPASRARPGRAPAKSSGRAAKRSSRSLRVVKGKKPRVSAPSATRRSASKKAAVKRAGPKRPAGSRKAAARKRPAPRPARRPGQATRSTKAPGAGRKPAR
jgi:hydroxyacylglutathione hydrolase